MVSDKIKQMIATGQNLNRLTPQEDYEVFQYLGELYGVKSAEQCFMMLEKQGVRKIYAKKELADALIKRDKISMVETRERMITETEEVSGETVKLWIVVKTICRPLEDGTVQTIESIGCSPVKPPHKVVGSYGQVTWETDLGNALKRSDTQAKRRGVLSICGIGLTDESEIADIPSMAGVVAALKSSGTPVPVAVKPAAIQEKITLPTAEPEATDFNEDITLQEKAKIVLSDFSTKMAENYTVDAIEVKKFIVSTFNINGTNMKDFANSNALKMMEEAVAEHFTAKPTAEVVPEHNWDMPSKTEILNAAGKKALQKLTDDIAVALVGKKVAKKTIKELLMSEFKLTATNLNMFADPDTVEAAYDFAVKKLSVV